MSSKKSVARNASSGQDDFDWRVGSCPQYAAAVIEDEKLTRHVRVKPAGATLESVKRAILKAYEDQYQPRDITLFTRKYTDDLAPLKTDRQLATQVLSYGPDWTDLAGPSSCAEVLLVVSPLNEEESELLVLPAAHSVPRETLLRHLQVPAGVSGAVTAAQPLLKRLADDTSGLFDPLPLPGHIDDWLAQYREALQSTPELLGRSGPRPAPKRDVIYIQPLTLAHPGGGQDLAAEAEGLFASLLEYLVAFFTGTPVKLLPPITLRQAAGGNGVSLFGKRVSFRDYCPGNEKPQPHGQLCAPELLRAMAPISLRGKGKDGKTHVGGGLPPDGFCVLGVTLTDIYCADDDVFTGGLADLNKRVGLFSFHRYLYVDRKTGAPASGAEALLGKAKRVARGLTLARACKTAAHEVMHMYGIGHCLHRWCLMNGAGHLLEDFAAPPYCCPVDLSKLIAALGPSCEVVPRYRALLRFCAAQPTGEGDAFAAQARWIRKALKALGASPAEGEGEGEAEEPAEEVHAAAAAASGAASGSGAVGAGVVPAAEDPTKGGGGKKRARAAAAEPRPKAKAATGKAKAKAAAAEVVTEVLSSGDEGREEEVVVVVEDEEDEEEEKETKEEAVHVAPPGLSLQESMEDVPLAERLAARMKAAKATRES